MGIVNDAVQGVVGSCQPSREGQQQHGDVADVVDVGTELGRIAGPNLLGHLQSDVVAEHVVGVALLGDARLLVRQD